MHGLQDQTVLISPPLRSHAVNSMPPCHRIWDSFNARFDECSVPIIEVIPGTVAILIIIFRLIRISTRGLKSPRWTRPFVQEPKPTKDDLPDEGRRYPGHSNALFITSFLGLILQIAAISYPQVELQDYSVISAWAISSIILIFRRPRTPPWTLSILYCSIIFTEMVVLTNSHQALHLENIPDVLAVLAAVAAMGIIFCMPIRHPKFTSDEISTVFEPPTSHLRSPEDKLNLWQFFSAAWMTPLISVGKKRQINDEDVWSLAYEFQHRRLFDRFRALRGSVLIQLLKANGRDLVIMTLLAFAEILSTLSVPVLLQQLLKSMEDPKAPRSAAVTYAFLSLAARFIAFQSDVLCLWYSRRAYERSRGEMITMLYDKTLTRKIVRLDEKDTKKDDDDPAKSKESASMGKIMNLMRFDSYEVSQRFWEFPALIFRPSQLVLSILLIWRIVGWSSLAGAGAIVVAQVINFVLARLQLRWETIRRSATDEKLKRISQFVEAIRHLRWYGWQETWIAQIMTARQRELNLRIVVSLWRILIGFVNKLASGLFPVIAFYAYTVWAGKPLRVDVAFPALQLFSLLDEALRDIPDLITVILNAQVAVRRLEAFMAEPNKDDDDTSSRHAAELEIKNASFSWPGASDFVLKDISLTFPTGLTIICGEVASGKTALLQALLGELDLREGELHRPNEMVGYCAQTPWLESMSIRDNILFASHFDRPRYEKVLEACALTVDMANFKHGDLSNIGENGIGLSGGQKARVALARAVYSQAKILLLDDPLSALDSQTAETIVRRCLAGSLLKGRTTILVTHRTELCYTLAKQIVEVSHGNIRILDPEVDLSHGLHPVLSTGSQDEGPPKWNDEKETAEAEKAIEEEYRAHGGVNFSIYWEYIKAGKLKWWALLVFVLSLYRLVDVAETWFLKSWGEAYGKDQKNPNDGFRFGKDPLAALPSPEKNIKPWLIGFFLIAVGEAMFFVISQCVMVVIVYTAGKKMFRDMIQRVSSAAFRYYDVTPIGRLMNRLTSDANTIDGNISQQFHNVARMSLTWLFSIIVIASVTPIFLVFSLALTAMFVIIFLRFLPTSQSLRRLEMVSLSPLMSNFGALLEGLTTVRAYAAQERFLDRLIGVVDTFQKMDHFYWTLQAWLMYRFDALSAFSTLLLTLIALYTGVSAGLTAFVLTAANKFVNSTHGLCRAYGQLQMEFVSVERVVELLHLEQEPAGEIDPPASWPGYSGDIVFEDVTMRYAEHLDPALEDVSLTIKAGSSTALLGRTGSGKSTLALSLLATILPEKGRILIDGIDISKVNTQTLRSRITFLAQEPVLFPGSMRMNLDPLEAHSDEECSRVLSKIAGRHGWSLTTAVDAGGKNLSQGQRQLVGLARAMLRRSSIVIFDEATASIDTATAREIQGLLREELSESTVITIAHRLEAVRGATNAVVLGKGKVIRMGTAEEMIGDLGPSQEQSEGSGS